MTRIEALTRLKEINIYEPNKLEERRKLINRIFDDLKERDINISNRRG